MYLPCWNVTLIICMMRLSVSNSGMFQCSNIVHLMHTTSCLNFAMCVHLGELHVQLNIHGVMVLS